MTSPIKRPDYSFKSYEGLQSNKYQRPLTPLDKALQSIMREVDLALSPPKSLRLRLWSKIASHISPTKAKFLSRIILTQNLVKRDNVASVAHMLSPVYIPSISQTAIAKIRPEDISKMDIKQIKAFTADQIKMLNSEQISALTVDQICGLSNLELQTWLDNASSLNSLLAKRFELVFAENQSTMQTTTEDFFNHPERNADNLKADINRAGSVHVGNQIFESVRYKDQSSRLQVIMDELNRELGEENVAQLSKFAHQGLTASAALIINSTFLVGDGSDRLIPDASLAEMKFTIDNGYVVVDHVSTGRLYSTLHVDDNNQVADQFALPFVIKGTLRVPLADLQQGDFSHATRSVDIEISTQK